MNINIIIYPPPLLFIRWRYTTTPTTPTWPRRATPILQRKRNSCFNSSFNSPPLCLFWFQVEVYYNPKNTNLGGSERVFMRGGWNRWRHPKPFGPIEMTPPVTGDHFRVRHLWFEFL